jgi:hypothetical protein
MTYDPFDPFDQLLTETPAHLLASGGFWVKQQFYEEPPVYQDFFLKFADQAAADAVLFDEQTNVQDDVVETVKVPKYAAVDVIGVIYKPTGKLLTTDEGEVPEMAPVDGWHANVRHTAEAPELEAYRVFPQSPVRGWA